MLLETVTGRLIDVQNPDPATICIDDIAWGLSRLPRFCGHTITVVPYNVSQHSLYVVDEVDDFIIDASGEHDPILSLKALLHDSPEAYMGDWPSPVKHLPELRPIIKKYEDSLLRAIFAAFNIPPMTPDEERIIKRADRIAQKIEAHAFMSSRGKGWPDMPEVSLEKLQQFSAPMSSLDSYKAFMLRFEQLIIQLK